MIFVISYTEEESELNSETGKERFEKVQSSKWSVSLSIDKIRSLGEKVKYSPVYIKTCQKVKTCHTVKLV